MRRAAKITLGIALTIFGAIILRGFAPDNTTDAAGPDRRSSAVQESSAQELEIVPATEARTSSRRWVSALRHQRTVAFQDSPNVATDSSVIVQPLPNPLDADEKRRLLSMFDAAVLAASIERDGLQGSIDPTKEDDLLAEAGMDRSLAIARAARKAIESDAYVLMREGDPYISDIPDGVVMTNNKVRHAGVAADAILYLRYDDYPDLRRAADRVDQMESFWGECKAAEFNALPLSERMARFAAHDSVPERLRNVPDSIASDPRALTKWQNDIKADLLPHRIYVDRNSFIARYASRRR